jgi:hypothetical protein
LKIYCLYFRKRILNMAQTGYTPIKLYASVTPAAVPLAANLDNTNGAELAINIADGKLYFKNSSNAVTLLAQSGAASPVTTISFGTTGLTPSTATSGAITVAGTLALANGGTGATTVSGAQTNLQVDPAGTAVAMAIALG